MRSSAVAAVQSRKPNSRGGSEAALSKARLRVWLRILKVSRLIEADLRERLRDEFDTTLPRFDVLAALYRAEKGLKMSELSQVLRVSNGNVTGIVDRLVAAGMMVRLPVAGDRRAMMVRLTAKGRAAFTTMAGVHEKWVNDLLGCVDGESTEELLTLLGRVSDSAQETRSRAR